MQVGTAEVLLTLKSTLEENAKRAEDAMNSLESRVRRAGQALAGAFSAKALLDLASAASQAGSAIVDGAERLQMGRAAYQELAYAAEQAGVSQAQFESSILMLNRNLSQGSDSLVYALSAVGLSIDDLRAMEPDQAFMQIQRAVKDMQDPFAKAKLATEAFGRSGQQILPFLNSEVDDLRGRAQSLGLVMSTEASDAADTFGDAMDETKRRLVVMRGEAMAPVMQWFSEAPTWMQVAIASTDTFGAQINALGMAMLVMGINPLKLVALAFGALSAPVLAVIAAVGALIAIWYNWDEIVAYVKPVFDWFAESFPILTAIIIAFKDIWVDNFTSLVNWFRDSWLGEKLMPIFTKIGEVVSAVSGWFGSMFGEEAKAATDAAVAATTDLTTSTEGTNDALARQRSGLTASSLSFKENTQEVRAQTTAQREAAKQAEIQQRGLESTWSTLRIGNDVLSGHTGQVEISAQAWAQFGVDLDKAKLVMGEPLVLDESMQALINPAPQLTAAQQAYENFRKKIEDSEAAQKLSDRLTPPSGAAKKWADFGKEIQETIQRTIENQGFSWQAIGSSVGSLLGGKAAEKLTEFVSGQFSHLGKELGSKIGGSIGGALGAVMPALGSILGSVAGSVLGPLLSAIVKGVQSEETIEVSPRRDQFYGQFQEGGLAGRYGDMALHLALSRAQIDRGMDFNAAEAFATQTTEAMRQAKSYSQYAAAEAQIIAAMRELEITVETVQEWNKLLVAEQMARTAGVTSFADRSDVAAMVDQVMAGETLRSFGPGIGGFIAGGAASMADLLKQPGFANGTPGLGFVDFGAGSLVPLHGREAVVPEGKGGEFASRYMGGVEDRLDRLDSRLADLPRAIGTAVRDATVLR